MPVGPAAATPKPALCSAAGHTRTVVDLRQRAVVADGRHALAGGTDRDVPDLPIRRQIAEQDEVAQRVAHRLLVQRRLEDAAVEPGGCRGVGNDDVEVFEAEVLQRQRLCRREPAPP